MKDRWFLRGLILVLLMLAFSRVAMCSTYSVTVIGEPGAVIYLNERYHGELNDRGVLQLNRVPHGNIRLRAEKRGFSSFESLYMINSDRTIVLELVSTRRFPFLTSGTPWMPYFVFSVLALAAVLLFLLNKGKWDFASMKMRLFKLFGNGSNGKSPFPGKRRPKGPQYTFYTNNLIGRGGMAHLYLEKHIPSGRQVALKLLNEELKYDEDMILKFRKEANALRKIRDKYKDVPVVKYIDEGQMADGRFFLIMEYLEGGPLQVLLKQGHTFSMHEIADISTQILQGLHAAHSVGVLHNDLSPDNIIANWSKNRWKIKIIDFGVAKMNSSDFPTRGDIFGKPCYMAPEAADGHPSVQSDLYSFGVILFHLVEGNPPFDDTNPITVYHQHKTCPVPKISRPVPDDIKNLIAYLMKKNPEERPGGASDVIQLLGKITIN